jgi:hypothetical protein
MASRTSRRASRLAATLAIVAALVAGCAGPLVTPNAATPTADGAATPAGTASSPASGTPTAAPTTTDAASQSPAPTATPAADADPWRTAALTDVRSGDVVSVESLAGKLVVVEPMAIWCTSCAAQQNELRSALETLDRPTEVVAVSLDVDPFEHAADLAGYADQRGYPWHFAIAGPDVSRLLAEAFGDSVLSPPSTPKIVVAPDGTAEIIFGFRSADELVAHFESLLP